MATQFQNRLIGTVILVSLGVIFLPDLLMGKKNDISAPAGSIPLRPEQSLNAVVPAANQTTNIASGAVSTPVQMPANADNSAVIVTSGNNTNPAVTSVSSGSPAVVANNESWHVDEVAAPVTITDKGAESMQMPPAAQEPAVDNIALQNKARELEQKKQAMLAAAKAKELAKAKATELEAKKKAQLLAQQSIVEPTVETIPAKTVTETQPTARRDENGITVKTAAEVEAERAAKKSGYVAATNPVANSSGSTVKQPTSSAGAGSWIIQVGVFSNAENAKALVTKLRGAGYGASAQRSGSSTRVVVGPDVSKSKLQSMLGSINSIGGTSARVISYSAISR